MLTREQAMNARHFEHVTLRNANGTPLRARRNGKTQTWKTRPEAFRLPIKHGLYTYGDITEANMADWRVAE